MFSEEMIGGLDSHGIKSHVTGAGWGTRSLTWMQSWGFLGKLGSLEQNAANSPEFGSASERCLKQGGK